MERRSLYSPGKDPHGEAIGQLNKGLGWSSGPLDPEEIARRGWNLLAEDLSLPTAVLYREKLEHNAASMQRFIDAYGVKLAPHGKTTMAPRLFQMQLERGAWGITLATAHQTRVAHAHGVRRVLMANQLVGRANMEIVSHLLADPDFEFFCLVDSAANVEQLAAFFSGRGQKIQVLLELGVPDGRSGVRDEAQMASVLQALNFARETVLLSGVEVYEGVLQDAAAVQAFLERAVDGMRQLLSKSRFERQPAILSGAGSAWYDMVAEAFSRAGFGEAVEIVLRPGCYLTHDVGAYSRAQDMILQRNPVARSMQMGLLPVLQVWAYVQSVPEPERAIVGLGKRDAAFDAGLPVPAARFRPGEPAPMPVPSPWTLTKMMDQHAFLQIAAGDDLRVGDMIAFDISHPCLTFDKWRCLPVLDAGYGVVDVVETFF